MSGLKYDEGKPDLSLISRELMEEVAKVRMFGANMTVRSGGRSKRYPLRQTSSPIPGKTC